MERTRSSEWILGGGGVGNAPGVDRVQLIFVNVASLLIFALLAASAYLTWRLIDPYATGVGSAVLLSVVLRHRFVANKHHDAEVARLAEEMRQQLKRRSLWTSWIAHFWPSIAVQLVRSVDHAATFNGLRKYPLMRRSRLFRVVSFVAMIAAFCYAMKGIQVFMWSSACIVALTLVLGLFVSDARMPSVLRQLNVLFVIAILLLFARSVVDEGNQFRADAVDAVNYVRGFGVNVPAAAIENAPIMISNYFFSENATAVMVELISSLPPKDGSSDAMTPLEAAGYAWEGILAGDFARVRRLVPDNYTSALGEVGLTVSSHVKNAGIAIANGVVSAVLFTLALVYELGLFYFVLRFLGNQPRTVVYHAAKRILSWTSIDEAANETSAIRCEEALTEKFDLLFQSYWHLIFFNFGATFFVQTVCGVRYAISSAFFSVVFAVIPIGVPVSLPSWIGVAVFAFQGRYMDALILVGTNIATQLYGGLIGFFSVEISRHTHRQGAAAAAGAKGRAAPAPAAPPKVTDTSVMTTSVILGFVSFGVKGIVLGPMIVIAAQEMWKACAGEVVASPARAHPPPAASFTPTTSQQPPPQPPQLSLPRQSSDEGKVPALVVTPASAKKVKGG